MKKRSHKKIFLRRIEKFKIFLIFITIFTIFLFIFILTSFKPVKEVEEIQEGLFRITITSPLNKTYHTKNIIFNVSTNFLASEIFWSMDPRFNITECMSCTGFTRYSLIFPDGAYMIKFYAINSENRVFENVVSFTVKSE
jgi:hypothetical protein